MFFLHQQVNNSKFHHGLGGEFHVSNATFDIENGQVTRYQVASVNLRLVLIYIPEK